MTITTVATALPAGGGVFRCCGICGAGYRTEFQRCPNDGGALALTDRDPLIGKVLGDHYVVEALIGEGAMGRVYRAHHHRLVDKRFAVKVMLGDLAVDPEMRMRFAREAEATSRLDHPAIVAIHDFGRSDSGLLYLVMELVEGETLGRVLRRGPMSPARVLRLTRQLCQGLAHAHARGIIHRDLKPDNLLVTAPGTAGERVRISDFGLAITRDDDDARLTTSGVVCTPAYAAPEQLLGKAIDPRADLYALGSTMFEMLTGGIPVFSGDAQAVTAKKLAGDRRSLAAVAPHTSPELVRLVHRLLETSASKRPPSALDVIARLDGSALDPTVAAPTVQPQRRRWIVGACAVIAVTVAGAVPSGVVATAAPVGPAVGHGGIAPRVVGSAAAAELAPARASGDAFAATLDGPAAPPHAAPARRTAEASLHVVSMLVEGSLPRSVVERAVDRALPALQGCRTTSAQVAARFTIDESRRASEVHASSACVAAALAHVRTEIAPDMGNTTISLRLARP